MVSLNDMIAAASVTTATTAATVALVGHAERSVGVCCRRGRRDVGTATLVLLVLVVMVIFLRRLIVMVMMIR